MTMKKSRNWTTHQQQAINERHHDMLVAAAAGSGKTAVLVERVIRMMIRQRIDIDDLLVVTFTKAAAAEMRERIAAALEEQLAKDPDDVFLRRQQALVGKASIMTLHAFCMSVVKKYYYLLDLDPGFRLLDETESALLREEVLAAVLEDRYESADEAFFGLVDRYSSDRDDDRLRQLIFRLYDFSRSHPWPDDWLERMADAYRTEGRSIDSFPWLPVLKRVLRRDLAGMRAMLDEALELCAAPGGPSAYAETIQAERDGIDRLFRLTHASWETIRSAFLSFSFDRLKTDRSQETDGAIKEQVQKLRGRVKERMTAFQQQWFARSTAEALSDLTDMAPFVKLLARLVKEFADRFGQEKRRRGVLDFSDLEHECLAVLRGGDATPGHEVPSLVARRYRSEFAEVLVDEYQDTNRVQEAILQLVTGGKASGARLFMVGDVKQSIYGFRLAEPALFSQKYKQFSSQETAGMKIDLARNFRSRPQVINGINYIFKQIMDESVGGVNYDHAAQLRVGAIYPPADRPAELQLIDRAGDESEDRAPSTDSDTDASALEAAAIADRIEAMIGDGTAPAFQVFDRQTGRMRAVRYRDFAVLLRSGGDAAAAMKDVLTQRGIPAYAELTKGYFDTIEITVMLSVLQLIDNPFQDIPLAAVLRSPLVGLNADTLAKIRMENRSAPFYIALTEFARKQRRQLPEPLAVFLQRLDEWRNFSCAHSVSELIWRIYRETGYYDYVGGLAGGSQRRANLRAFYDRARQYEKTSFRGLFRFLRFIERMRKSGGDLGEAKALSQQEDVVRIMTIHKSKGLEFPIVFVAGMARHFNMQETTAPALLHKTLGFGTRWIDPAARMSVPTLPYLAMKEQIRSEARDEEMRILYVALTRAQEKLILVATVADAAKAVSRWRFSLNWPKWKLPAYVRGSATCFLDWIGPCLVRHRSAGPLHDLLGADPKSAAVAADPSEWAVRLIPARSLEGERPDRQEADKTKLTRLREWKAVTAHSGMQDEVRRRLEWGYPFQKATVYMAKQTVTELRAQQDYFSEGRDDRLTGAGFSAVIADRPHFLQSSGLSPAERGTAMHLLMQHADLRHTDIDSLHACGRELLRREMITPEQEKVLDYGAAASFFRSPIGLKMGEAERIRRECPFSLMLEASDVYPSVSLPNEQVLIQGVIDCIIEEKDGLTLIDYKTDELSARFPKRQDAATELRRRYGVQLALYRTAIEKIWKESVVFAGLYAFDGGFLVDLTDERMGEES
jgi:ATP-dependent helicase/nuclease subunit A